MSLVIFPQTIRLHSCNYSPFDRFIDLDQMYLNLKEAVNRNELQIKALKIKVLKLTNNGTFLICIKVHSSERCQSNSCSLTAILKSPMPGELESCREHEMVTSVSSVIYKFKRAMHARISEDK